MHPVPTSLALALLVALSLPGAATASTAEELAALKAQVQQLLERIEELEARTDAQSDVNIDTATAIGALQTPSTRVETRGGVRVSSADKQHEFVLGGRVHFDAYAFDRDLATPPDTTEFRRGRITLSGRSFGWDYKLEQDFASGTNLDGLRDAFIARALGPGRLTIGHFKPYRSMEELTSSNEMPMMERPFSSASGLFAGRQFQQGLGYLVAGGNHTLGVSVFNLRNAAGPRNEGVGVAGRATWTPIQQDARTVHLGAWASSENSNDESPNLSAVANYAGRRGPALTIATTPGSSGASVDAFGLEAAARFDRLFLQSEAVRARFGQPGGSAQDVDSWYLQGSWMLTGGSRTYKPATGVFGAPRVSDASLWELTARLDHIENRDLADRQARSWLLGLNWYLNPSLRLMFNITDGDNALSGDRTRQYALRTQFHF